jgi:hypothetical protein
MLTEEQKYNRRGRHVYYVNEQPMPATPVQRWSEFQLQCLDAISADQDFDYWYC